VDNEAQFIYAQSDGLRKRVGMMWSCRKTPELSVVSVSCIALIVPDLTGGV